MSVYFGDLKDALRRVILLIQEYLTKEPFAFERLARGQTLCLAEKKHSGITREITKTSCFKLKIEIFGKFSRALNRI
jgi:hypothetical protein